MSELKISCPKCEGHVQFPEEIAGQTISCPHCGDPLALQPESASLNCAVQMPPAPPTRRLQPAPVSDSKSGAPLTSSASAVLAKLRRFFARAKTPLEMLGAKIGDTGHPDYPFLHQHYSPGSRVPCADFTGFITERLELGDVHSIKDLMHEVLRGNPGLGLSDGSWIDAEISKTLEVHFQDYIQFVDPKAYRELASMWILAAKDGSGREFWISPECKFPTFFSWALCPYQAAVTPSLLTLVKRANRWLAKMRKDVPFWLSYPDFDKGAAELRPFKPGPASAKLLELPIGARLHFFTALSFGLGNLPDLTDYKLRSFGLYIPHSVNLLIGSQLLVPGANAASVAHALSKGELACECDRLGIPAKKSWTKQRLLEAIMSVKPDFLAEIAASKSIVAVNSEYADEISMLVARSLELEKTFRALCFAG